VGGWVDGGMQEGEWGWVDGEGGWRGGIGLNVSWMDGWVMGPWTRYASIEVVK
jgi:hypothetical protein